MDAPGAWQSNDSMSPAKLRCVVVDDDHEFLEQVKRWFLTSCTDFEVLTFGSSIDALDYIRRERVDLVLTAYLVSPVDGLQTISIIRAFNPRLPICMMSSVPLAATALARGATEFLAKFRVRSELEAVLAKLREQFAPLAV